MNFKNWLQENDTANQISNAFAGMAGGIDSGVQDMNMKYAQRILAGERPEDVLQGLKVNGHVWTSVMALVQQLRAKQAPQPQQTPQQVSQQPQAQQLSVSGIEQRLGVANGSLAIQPSGDGKSVFVRNRHTGQVLQSPMNPAEIEATARKVFGMV